MPTIKQAFGGMIIAIITLAAALSLFGCNAPGSTQVKDPKANFIGTWDIISMEDPEQGNLGEMIEMLKGMNARLDVTFENDGAVKINIATTSDDESLIGTWEVVDEKTARLTIDGNSQDAVIDKDGQLVMEQDGVKMVCFKNDGTSSAGSDSAESPSFTQKSS